MYSLIHFLLTGRLPCKHKFSIIDVTPVRWSNGEVNTRYHLQCDKCGKMVFEESSL